MRTNWHELRDLGNERARAAVAEAQRRHRAADTSGDEAIGRRLHAVWMALRGVINVRRLSARLDAAPEGA